MADNPSAGGGKIRSRRAAAARKPYSRASSQKSLFSRVTDSVKSLLNPITPKWLVSRLGHEEEMRSQQRPHDIDPDQPSTSMNHQEQSYSRTNNNYKRSPLSRQPLRPGLSKTSASSLQYYVTPPDTPAPEEQADLQSTSTGKEGLVKHLTMASKRLKLESGSPTLIDSSQIRNEMKLLSTNDNASIASSSGCSSSVQVGSQRTNTSDNEIGQKPHWSSSMDSLAPSSKTSSSRQQATMTSHKRPRFNPAIFGMPSLGAHKYTDPQESSFYEGPVQFGGANASARSPYFASPYKIPSVTKVKVRHVNHQRTPARVGPSTSRSSKSPMDESSTVGMSSTAKKILQTLETMSSPLNDARKIPTMTRTPSSFAADRRRRRTIAGSSLLSNSLQPPPVIGLSSPSTPRMRRRSHMPSNNSLLAKKTQDRLKDEPKADSIKEQPTQRVETAERSCVRGAPAPIASMSSSASMSVKSPPTRNEGSGGGGKMKSQKRTSSHYSSMQEEEPEDEPPNLPDVPLPVSSLPSFNFGKSLVTSTPAVRPQDKNDKSSKQPEFNFASPLIKTTKTDQSQSSANNTPKFQFSSPPTKASSLEGVQDTPKARTQGNFSAGSKAGGQSLVFAPDPKVVSAVKAAKRRSSPLATPDTETSRSSGMRPAESLKSGSVMDILSGKTTKGVETSGSSKPSTSKLPPLKQNKSGWSCEVCLVPNDDTADSCVACATPKPGGSQKPPLSSVFGKKKGWDCGTCMIPNDADAEKCVACETPKPGSAVASSGSKSAFGGSSIFKTGDPVPKTQFSFGLPKKKDSEATPEASNSLSQKFKKAEGSWECGVCLVQNDASSTKCDACQTPKPGCESIATAPTKASTSSTTPKFKFGLPAASTSSGDRDTKASGWGNLAKKSGTTWECEVCMVPNPEERKTCEACDSPKPGTKKELTSSFKFGENSSGLFKFGLPSNKKTEQSEKGDGVSEIKKEQTTQSLTAVSQTTANKESTSQDSAPAKPTFSFGLPANKAPTLSAGVKTPVFSASSKPDAPVPTFTFGQKTTPKQPETAPTKPEASAPTFTFGQKAITTAQPAQKATSDSVTKPPIQAAFGFGTPKSQEASSEPAKLPAFGKSAVAPSVPAFGIKPQPTTSTSFEAPKSSVEQTQPVPTKPSFGGSVFGVPQSEDKKTPAAPNFAFGTSSSGTFGFGQSSGPAKQPATSAPSSQPTFNFGGAKPTVSQQTTPAFGLSTAAAGNPSQFSGFGTPAQQTQQSNVPPKAEPAKPTFPFGAGQNTATPQQSSGGVFGSTSGVTANPSPFSTPVSKPAFPIGPSASSSPFGTSNASGSNNMFGKNTKSNSVFGVPSTNPAQGVSSSSSIFGASSNAIPVFGAPSSDKSSTIPKPTFTTAAFQFTANSQSSSSNLAFGSGSQQSNNPTSQPSTGFNFGATPSKGSFSAAPAPAPSGGFPFGGGKSDSQSNGVFQFGAGGNNQSNPDPTGGNKPFAFGGSNNANSSTGGTGFNFGASAAQSFNFSNPPAFGGADAPSNQNMFAPQRSTTPNNQARRRLQARRKLKK